MMISSVEKINADFDSLYNNGMSRLSKDCSAIMNDCRLEAMNHFRELGGVPNKVEDYCYFDIVPYYDHDYTIDLSYKTHDVSVKEAFRCGVTNMDTLPVITVNGWFLKEDVGDVLPQDIVVCSLREASIKYPQVFAQHYNSYAKAATRDGLVSLNTVFAGDGVFIYVPDGVVVDKPIQLINLLRSSNDMMGFQRNMVVVGKNAELKLLICDHTESDCNFLMNTVTEVFLDKDAKCDYYQIQSESNKTVHINSMFTHQESSSKFETNILSLYGGLIRNNLFVELCGEHAENNLYGLYIMDMEQKVDTFTFVDHKVPNCLTNECFKGILDDAALGNFGGIIRVRPLATGSVAYQSNQNLLLSDNARMNTKPQLIIDNDDVKCSHGASCGQIDEEALFYLRSRGIGLQEATMIMMFGFAHDIIGRVKIEALRLKIDSMVERRLRGERKHCDSCCHSCNSVEHV